ncbi:MAG: hypothetical protein CSA62_02455 [Planctomycetota bacterium]|nr:MAG: hypothetical protein CSA62_02455 [Planctomycetota bacterium]
MVEIKEEPKPGVPAFMATFADLMTLLLVFFILLNVYAHQRQYGLIAAMTGSFRNALLPNPGEGGLQEGFEGVGDRKYMQRLYRQHDDMPGEASRDQLTGSELDMQESKAKDLAKRRETLVLVPWSFAHGSDRLPEAGRKWLDDMARKLSSKGHAFRAVRVATHASFSESIQPLELATNRSRAVMRRFQENGLSQALHVRCSAHVVDGATNRRMLARKGKPASYRGMSIVLVRR